MSFIKPTQNLLWPLSSGSAGNASLARLGDTLMLIDDGLPLKEIVAGLESIGATLDQLQAVLITHAHGDHIRGLRPLVNATQDLPIYASSLCLTRVRPHLPSAARLESLDEGWPLSVGAVEVVSFPTSHDAPGSIGFRLSGEGSVIAYATDLGVVTPKVLEGLKGADAILLESNHDPELLANGPYPPRLKRRVASKKGHLSNQEASAALSKVITERTQVIFLGHLSDENNTHEHALETVRPALKAAPDADLFVAPQRETAVQGWIAPRATSAPPPPLWRRPKQGTLFTFP